MKLSIHVGKRAINAIPVSEYECAWPVKDSLDVLEYFLNKQEIILGGEILTSELQYTYDSWYYNINTCLNDEENLKASYAIAKRYISNYLYANGTNFFVIITREKTEDRGRFSVLTDDSQSN